MPDQVRKLRQPVVRVTSMLEEQSRNEVPNSQMSVIFVALGDKSVDSLKVSDMTAEMVILLNTDRGRS